MFLSCFNQERTIGVVLDALLRQKEKNFEIIVADDGSIDGSHRVILKYPVLLVTQRSRGFRKARILNEASRHIRSRYIILLDGDCVPHRDFVRSHLVAREKGRYLAGRRVDIPRELSEKIMSLSFPVDMQRFLIRYFWKAGKLNRIFQVKNPFLRKIFDQDRVIDMMGCNGSFWYDDFLKVDGFDEIYEGYFREDGDLDRRLSHSGTGIKSVKGLALVYHLWHPRREDQNNNEARFQETIDEKRITARKGLHN